MNYRHPEILADVDLGGSGTKIIDINLTDIVSRFTLRFLPVGGSVDMIAHPAACISKIELVDGSDVHFDLSGQIAHGLNQIEADKPITTHIDSRIGGTPILNINMDFGRYLYDPEMAYDPTKFKNPQLKITWNEKAWDASCGSHSFAIWADVFDEKAVSPVGFLMNKVIKSYVPVANAYEYTDLPTDYPMRKLIMQGLKAGFPYRTLIDAIKLSEDNDKRVPIDGDSYKLEPLLIHYSGECEDDFIGQSSNVPRTFYCTPTYCVSGGVNGIEQAEYYQLAPAGGGSFVILGTAADKMFAARIKGFFPHACVPINFGQQNIIEDWYDVTKVGSLKLRLKGGAGAAATDTVHLATQQLRRY